MKRTCCVLGGVHDLVRPWPGRVLAALLLCAVLANGATMGTSSWLHVNLSFVPFTYYYEPAASYGFTGTVNGTQYSSCPSGVTVQGCFRTILAQMRAQAVSGIRIFVTFCDSSSLAFTNDGVNPSCGSGYQNISWNPSGNQYQAAWIGNVQEFFQDVANAQIQNVSITTGSSGGSANTFAVPKSQTFSPAAGTNSNGQPYNCSQAGGNCCSDTPDPVYFNTLVPFGMYSNGTAIGGYFPTLANQGYNCAPINQNYFLGWTNYLNVINAVLGAAKAACPAPHNDCVPLTVYELETQEELTPSFTVLMRYIYDNSIPQSGGVKYPGTLNLLSAMRSLMTANGFDPGRVQWSGVWFDASNATDNCLNAYVDYERNGGLDFVAQAINGGPVGNPTNGALDSYGLFCGGTASNGGLLTSPIYSTLPDIVDTHIYPKVTAVNDTDVQIQQVAALDYGDIPHFLALAGLQSAVIVLGETYGGTLISLNLAAPNAPVSYCWQGSNTVPPGSPADNVAGFNNESVKNPVPLSSYTVIFRPWMELEMAAGACFGYGTGPGTSGNYQSVNYNGSGPYTPTNH